MLLNMYTYYFMIEMFRGGGDFGRGSAIASVIMIAVIPILVWNVYNARKEMK